MDHKPYMAPSAMGYQTPHRGGLILGLGITSLLCNFFLIPGILAWVWGRSDLQQIRAGQMDRTGEGLTQAGMVIGMIATILPLVVLAIYFTFIVVLIVIGAASNI